MRIIAGEHRGLRLTPLGRGDASAHLRPTPDRVRESLFNLLAARVDWEGLRVLDVFAGTGALGLEALSRGAAEAVFIENGRAGQRLVRKNIALVKVEARARLLARDATRPGPCEGQPFDIVFLDPPYGKGLGMRALAALEQCGWLAPAALIAWEENAPQTPPEGFALLDQRRYGDTHITLLEAPG